MAGLQPESNIMKAFAKLGEKAMLKGLDMLQAGLT